MSDKKRWAKIPMEEYMALLDQKEATDKLKKELHEERKKANKLANGWEVREKAIQQEVKERFDKGEFVAFEQERKMSSLRGYFTHKDNWRVIEDFRLENYADAKVEEKLKQTRRSFTIVVWCAICLAVLCLIAIAN